MENIYKVVYNNGCTEYYQTNLRHVLKIAKQFYRMAKNKRFGLWLNFYTCAAVYRDEKMIAMIDNNGNLHFYKWNF